MSTIVTRAGKGSALTFTEVDANFTNLNNGKLETSGGTITGSLFLGGQSTADQYIRIGGGRTGNGYSYLDLQGDPTYSDGFRLIRANSGPNTASNIQHRGTGPLVLQTSEAGPITFVTTAVERMRITAAGDVGIGTSIPSYKLQAVGIVSSQVAVAAQAGYQLYNGGATTEWFMGQRSATNHSLSFSTIVASTYTDRMVIDGSGNVGIGTSSPGAKFDVGGGGNMLMTGASTGDQLIRVGAGRSGNGYSYLDLQGDTTYVDGLRFIRTSGGPNTASSVVHRGTGPLNLQTSEAGPITFSTTALERMRISSTGNVGIGTTDTTNKLQIDGGAVQNTGVGNIGQYELVYGSASTWYNSGWRNDGSNVYFLLSNVQTTQAAAKTAGFNSLRPLFINLASGAVIIDQTGAGGTTFGGAALAVGAGGLGYGTGSGGAVTQLTSRTTGVTLNKTNGAITMFSAAGNASPQTFVVTNSTVAATDVVHVSVRSSSNVYFVAVTSTSAGAFAICFYSLSGTATDAPVINFAVIKAATA